MKRKILILLLCLGVLLALCVTASAAGVKQVGTYADLRAAFQFWAADEDFPAQIGFFWDENVLSRLRYETLYYVMGDFLELLEARIAELERQ